MTLSEVLQLLAIIGGAIFVTFSDYMDHIE